MISLTHVVAWAESRAPEINYPKMDFEALDFYDHILYCAT